MFGIFELYEFSSRVRRRFANKLAELTWEEVTKNREASFYSMKNIMIHMIDNEGWIVNWVICNKSLEYKRERDSEEYRSMSEVLDHMNKVEAKTREYLKKIADLPQKEQSMELKRRVNFTLRSSGKSFGLSVEESLFQSFTEQLYHLGELIALLWQDNIEPPQMQWFWNNPRLQSSLEL